MRLSTRRMTKVPMPIPPAPRIIPPPPRRSSTLPLWCPGVQRMGRSSRYDSFHQDTARSGCRRRCRRRPRVSRVTAPGAGRQPSCPVPLWGVRLPDLNSARRPRMNVISRLLLGAAVLTAACQGKTERSPEETAAIDSARAAANDSAAEANSKELKVTGVMIGRQIGANDLITQPTFQFAPTDTVFRSVATVGSPDSTALSAVVIGQNGKTVDSTAQTIKPKGHATTPFRIAPAKGWKPGTYRVTLYADGDSVDAKLFAVKK